jgi:hypothetical protein
MKKSFMMLAFLAIASFSWAGKSQLKFKERVVVDGKNQEWINPLPFYDAKTGINYDVANDKDNLYLILRVVDNTIAQQIQSSGFEIGINPFGKKKKKMTVLYPMPMPSPTQAGGDFAPPVGQAMPKGQKKAERVGGPIVIQNQFVLTGFLSGNGQQRTDESPIHAVISQDQSGYMIYELSIPFKQFFKEKLEAKDKGAVFSICFTIKKSTMPSSSASTDRNGDSTGGGGMSGGGGMPSGGGGGMPGGGGGGMPGGGGGGGMPSGDSGQMGDDSGSSSNTVGAEKSYWFKVTPAIE